MYIVQQQISLFLEAQGCTLSFYDRGGCSSWVQRVTWREEREIISSPVPSPLTRESRPPCVNMGSKSPRPQEGNITTTSSPTQPPPLSTLATQQLMWTCSREWNNCVDIMWSSDADHIQYLSYIFSCFSIKKASIILLTYMMSRFVILSVFLEMKTCAHKRQGIYIP